jgi:hypothetical protein
MKRIILGLSLVTLFINTSCKKCKSCRYTYTQKTIVQGINGEETLSETLVGYVIDADGQKLDQECIKSSEVFSIDVAYDAEEETSTLEDFVIICEDS